MQVGSDIDATIPVDATQTDKALLRANFAAAKEEIEDLQQALTYARRIAFGLQTLSVI